MGRLFGPFNHVFRIAVLFAAGIAAFLVMRWWFVPSDFGVYGHYRAGALADNRGRALAYAGQVVRERGGGPTRPDTRAVCVGCHARSGGKPHAFPQVVVREHAEEGACTACHAAHKPAIS